MNRHVIISIFISIFIYHFWISFDNFLTGDADFSFSESLIQITFPVVWMGNGNIGNENFTIWNAPYTFFRGVFGFLDLHSNVAEKITIFWIIVIFLPLSCYLILKYFYLSSFTSLVGSFYFSYGSYFITIHTHGHLAISVATTFVLFSFYFFLRYIQENKFHWCIFSAFSMILAGSYDFRMVYIFLGVFLAFVLWESVWISIEKKKFIFDYGKKFILFSILFFLLSLYWIIPTFVPESGGMNQFLGRDLFGNDYFELQESLFLSHPFWTGYGVQWMSNQPTPWWLTILGILAFVGFWVGRKNPYIVFFALIAIIGIFLGKQVDPPFGNTYYWLYENLPGFNAFREASKFYVLIALGYSVGLASLVEWLLPKEGNEK